MLVIPVGMLVDYHVKYPLLLYDFNLTGMFGKI
jgi:hypothetical protein